MATESANTVKPAGERVMSVDALRDFDLTGN